MSNGRSEWRKRHLALIADDPSSLGVSIAKFTGGAASYFTIVLQAGSDIAEKLRRTFSEEEVDAVVLLTKVTPESLGDLPDLPLLALSEDGRTVRNHDGDQALLETLTRLRASLGFPEPVIDRSMDW